MDEAQSRIVETLLGFLSNDRKDSVEVGAPSKGGTIKVYFDSSRPEDARTRIDNAIMARNYANQKMGEGKPAGGQ